MSSLFDDLKQGLEEAIDYEKGNGKARVKTYMIMPIKEYSNKEIREIRIKAGMTQSVFASYMGVSKKTVEAWECTCVKSPKCYASSCDGIGRRIIIGVFGAGSDRSRKGTIEIAKHMGDRLPCGYDDRTDRYRFATESGIRSIRKI